MNVFNKLKKKNAELLFLISCLLLLLNFFVFSFNLFFFQKLVFFLILVFIPTYLLFDLNRNLKLIFAFFLILILFLFSIYQEFSDWDALNIWLFHAKRIYISGNIFEQFNNYLPSSHNDYPPFLPVLQASINYYFFDINFSEPISSESFFNPKLSLQANFILLIFPLYYLIKINKFFLNQLLFISIYLFISEKIILSGSVDNILGLYFVSLFIIILKCFLLPDKDNDIQNNNLTNHTLLICLTIILTLLKNEGIVLFLSLLISMIILMLINKKKILTKKFFLLILPLIPIAIWKYVAYKNHIQSDLINERTFENFYKNIFNMKSHWLIFNGLFLNKSILLPLIIFSASLK